MAAGESELRKFPVLVNAAAGSGRRDVSARIEAALLGAGLEGEISTVAPERIAAALRTLMAEGVPAVGVAGGDGTLLTAAEELAGQRVVLAPFPTGTLNHFARKLGLEELESTARALRTGETREIPLGVVDDRVFLNTATFGFYAAVVRRRERLRPLLRKWPAAAVAFATTVTRLDMLDVTLVVEGNRLHRSTALVWVGLGRGSFPFVHESPDRRRHPELEIVVLRPRGLLETTALIFRLLRKLRRRETPVQDPALEVLHSRQLLIQGQHRVSITLDGEVLRCEPPILVAVQKGALRVVSGSGDGEGSQIAANAAPTGSRG